MIKFPHIAHFHSLAEFFFAALLESNPQVERYVPQPFKLHFGKKTYIPDCYYIYNGAAYVAELKPRNKWDDALTQACIAYFGPRGASFVNVANEEVMESSVLAQNWMTIVRWLVTYKELDTTFAEAALIQTLLSGEALTYGEVTDLGNRNAYLTAEVAMFRLLHRGEITADIEFQFIGPDTRLQLC